MLVVLVVRMTMLVFHCLVAVPVDVLFAQVQVEPDSHQHARGDEATRNRLGKQRHGQYRPDERRGREVSGSACRTEIAQAEHEQHKTDPVRQKTRHCCRSNGRRSGNGRVHEQRQGEVRRPGHQPFDRGDLHRIDASQ